MGISKWVLLASLLVVSVSAATQSKLASLFHTFSSCLFIVSTMWLCCKIQIWNFYLNGSKLTEDLHFPHFEFVS